MKRFTRILALIICVVSLFSLSARPAKAANLWDTFLQVTGFKNNVDKTLNAVSESESTGTPSQESFVDNNLLNVQSSLFVYVAGPPESSTTGLSDAEKQQLYQRYGHGAIGSVGTGITALYTPPASSTTYVADLLKSAHVVPQAQAQGLGFASLDPILSTWKVFRNVAYFFFVVVFLIIGFMIMFRQKIGGQTVVTAQQAIPGIIVSLIFVTFSYAIAGFMIDIMYLLMYLIIGLFQPTDGTAILDKHIFRATWDILVGKGDGVSVFSSVGDAVGDFVGSFTGDLTGAIGDALGWIAGITAALVVGVAILIASFKIFFELLKTYVSIVISIATAPMILMMGAIPGQNTFFKWIKGLAGNLLAFPAVLMCFVIYDLFTQNAAGAGGVGQGGFIPPFLPGRGSSNAIVTLVGIGILLVIPEIIQQLKKAFGAEGGIAEQLGMSMLKNVQSNTQAGLNVGATAVGTGYGIYGGGLALKEARKQKLGFFDTARAVIGQGTKVDSGEEGDLPRYVGGGGKYMSRGLRVIRNIRRGVSGGLEGKGIDADDLQQAIENVTKNMNRDPRKDEGEETPPVTGSQPEEG